MPWFKDAHKGCVTRPFLYPQGGSAQLLGKGIILIIFLCGLFLCGCSNLGFSRGRAIYRWAENYIESNIKSNWEYKISNIYSKEDKYYSIFVELWKKGRKPWKYPFNYTCGRLWFNKRGILEKDAILKTNCWKE